MQEYQLTTGCKDTTSRGKHQHARIICFLSFFFKVQNYSKGSKSDRYYPKHEQEIHTNLEVYGSLRKAVAGFNHAKTITNASAMDLYARQVDFNKGIGSPGSLVNKPIR